MGAVSDSSVSGLGVCREHALSTETSAPINAYVWHMSKWLSSYSHSLNRSVASQLCDNYKNKFKNENLRIKQQMHVQ